MAPDVSVVLNVHREASFILRTMRSLDEAASFARQAGVRSELVIVFDRSDDLTRQVAKSTICAGFDAIRYIEADHGSLGPARNTGIAATSGEYVWLADADDLVSYNCIAVLHAIAITADRPVVFPQYLVAFGDMYGVSKYFDDSVISAADFIYNHPYISRIFLRRETFDNIQFEDVRLSSGFAYEDWHLNCELKARGYRFLIAPGTVFYYRQRKGSLLKQADAISARQIPNTSLADPAVLTRCVAEEMARCAPGCGGGEFASRKLIARQHNPREELLADPGCMEMTYAAIRIDPSMNFRAIDSGGSWVTVFPDRHWGHDYIDACGKVGSSSFSDIVLLPSLNAGGGERYILGVLASLSAESKSVSCLVIAGEEAESHLWLDRLPANAVFLDVANLFPQLATPDLDKLVLRLILAVGRKGARIHLKDSYFAIRWFSAYSSCTRSFFPIYYRFSDETVWKNGSKLTLGSSSNFISNEVDRLSLLLTDHRRIVAHDTAVFGVAAEKWQCVYAAVPVDASKKSDEGGPLFRLLWASRVCTEKRPEMLVRIASEAHRRIPRLRISVRGMADPGYDPLQLFSASPCLEYLGAYQTIDELQLDQYDALIYTSAYDGLPNTILEVMSRGLPVIAPDIGGISEVVQDGVTGFLLSDEPDEGLLVEGYVRSILRLYEDWERTRSMGRAARALIERQHSVAGHRARIRQLFVEGESQ